MRVTGVDHVAINCKDVEASVAFYSSILGFKRLETVPMEVGLALTYLAIPGGGRLELFGYKDRVPDRTGDEKEAGLRHLAFAVDSVEGVEKKLREQGVTVTLPTTDLPSLGARVILFLDPNGVTVEVAQKISRQEHKGS